MSAMNDETWWGIIIHSIPPTQKWLPVIPSLYTLSSSADVILTLLTHGMILGRNTSGKGTNSSNMVLATWMKHAQTLTAKQRNDLLTQLPTATGQEVVRKDSFCLVLAREWKQIPPLLPAPLSQWPQQCLPPDKVITVKVQLNRHSCILIKYNCCSRSSVK